MLALSFSLCLHSKGKPCHFPPGVQRQPLQKHNSVRGTAATSGRNASTFGRCLSSRASCAAGQEVTDRCSMSAVGCGRSSQDCQPATPSQGIAAQLAAWQKQHVLSAASVIGDSRRTPETVSSPSRQLSAGEAPSDQHFTAYCCKDICLASVLASPSFSHASYAQLAVS